MIVQAASLPAACPTLLSLRRSGPRSTGRRTASTRASRPESPEIVPCSCSLPSNSRNSRRPVRARRKPGLTVFQFRPPRPYVGLAISAANRILRARPNDDDRLPTPYSLRRIFICPSIVLIRQTVKRLNCSVIESFPLLVNNRSACQGEVPSRGGGT